MENREPTLQEKKLTAISSLRNFARIILDLANTQQIESPKTAQAIMSVTPHVMYDAQHHRSIETEDITYWKARMKVEYNQLVAEKFGFTPPQPDTDLPESPLARRFQNWSDGVR